jgi:predicted ester cyclase
VLAVSAEQTEALARRFVQQHNGAEYVVALDELLAPECVVHEYLPGLPEDLNPAGYKQFIATLRGALPDLRTVAEEVVVQGDSAAIRWTGTGTHTGGDLFGMPPNGKPLLAHGIYLLHVGAGRIMEIWNHWDTLNVVQQVTALPPPE